MHQCRHALAVVLIAASWSGAQAVLHVAASALGPGNGTVSSPYPSIQAGIVAASAGATVLVQPGTYFENLDFLGKAITVRTTAGPAVTVVDGGFPAYGPVVAFRSGEGPASILEGFTLTHGQGWTYPFSCDAAGGGIDVEYGSPTVRRCVIRNNSGSGGWFHDCYSSGPCGSRGGAGGIEVGGPSHPRIEHCILDSNLGGVGGHGQNHCECAGPGPGFAGGAGAVAVAQGAAVDLVNCLVVRNTGGIGGTGGDGTDGGACPGPGREGGAGGIGGLDLAGTAWLVATTIAGNQGGAGGAGGASPGFPPPPSGIPGPGGISGAAGAATGFNVILWANPPSGGTLPSVTYSLLPAASAGTGNFVADPLFVNPALGDFHISPVSPAVDAGTNGAGALPASDLDNHPRIFHGIADVGADETVLAQVLAQAGPGAPITLTNYNLTPGAEYYNIFSLDPCPGGIGQGPYAGLCATDTTLLVVQLNAPIGTDLFHFIAGASSITWGPYQLPPVILDGICFQLVGGTIGPGASLARLTIL